MNYESIIKDFLEKEKPYPKKIQKLINDGIIGNVVRINERYFLLILCYQRELEEFYSQFHGYGCYNLWSCYDGESYDNVKGNYKRFVYGYIIFDNKTSKICSSLINMIMEPDYKENKRYYCAPQKIIPSDNIKFDDVFYGGFWFPLTYMTKGDMWVHNIKNYHQKDVYQISKGITDDFKEGSYAPALMRFDRSNVIDIQYIENVCKIKIDETSLIHNTLALSNIAESIEKATDVLESGLNKVAFAGKLTADAIANKK